MNKADLKKRWGKYCDTDKLVSDMMELLKKYRHRCTEHGVCELLNEYFRNKESLIKLMSTSKSYIGDMRISLEKEFERKISSYDVSGFINNFIPEMNFNSLQKKTDENGKTFDDYMLTGAAVFDLDGLSNQKRNNERLKNMQQFDYNRRLTKASMKTYNEAYYDVTQFRNIYYPTLQRDYEMHNGIKLTKGTKTSRAFNKICTYYGIDKLNPETVQVEENGVMVDKVIYPYNKLFAYYSDLVSGLVRKMNFIISVNPLDYLTMSNGVSWRSCHMIDGGMNQGGCLSYLLDKTSIITFVIDNEPTPIHTTPKLYRQMFHYDKGLFMQNRLYPQGNDGATNLYEKFRDFVAEEFSELTGVGRKWKVECGSNACRNHVSSFGVHYKDYNHNNSCAVFYPEEMKSKISDYIMKVGHDGVCPNCGKAYSTQSRLSHSDCKVNNEEEDWDWIL
jgi:hypothetical protein